MGHDQPLPVGSVLYKLSSNKLCTQRPVLLSPPRQVTTSSGNIPNPLRANPKSAVSSTLVDSRTKHYLTCANTHTNVSSVMAITLRPCVPARAQINKHKPDTPLQPLLFAMSLCTITLIIHLLIHCFGHYVTVSILVTLVHVTFVYLST